MDKHAGKTAITILLSGLLAGSLDISVAFIDYYIQTGKGPAGLLKYVASGVYGNAAFTAGAIMAWSGLLFHFIIAFLFTLFFFIVYPRLRLLQLNTILSAAVIGVFIWLVMNVLVVPLSNTPKLPFKMASAVKAVLILTGTIGFPLSLILKRFYRVAPLIIYSKERSLPE